MRPLLLGRFQRMCTFSPILTLRWMPSPQLETPLPLQLYGNRPIESQGIYSRLNHIDKMITDTAPPPCSLNSR